MPPSPTQIVAGGLPTCTGNQRRVRVIGARRKLTNEEISKKQIPSHGLQGNTDESEAKKKKEDHEEEIAAAATFVTRNKEYLKLLIADRKSTTSIWI